jgi:uncharacterized repeat protein (TIGR03803 family)
MTRKGYSRSKTRLPLSCLLALAFVATASAEWKEKVLYSFQGGTDGSAPVGEVVFDTAGNLYGATEQGSGSDCKPTGYCGTVFQLKPPAKLGDPWTESVLHAFAGVTTTGHDGAVPAGGLVIDAAGNLYGTTAYGGSGDCVLAGIEGGCGTVYELEPPKTNSGDWTYRILYSLQGGKDGDFAWGDLAFDHAGNLYGATQFGGGFGSCDSPFYQFCGTVFELSPPKSGGGKWTEKVPYGFKGGKDGANPNGGLLFDNKGALLGTTQYGGGSTNCKTGYFVGCGTAFRLNPPTTKSGAWTQAMLRRFNNGADGAGPNGSLVFDAKGRLYGTATGGGIGYGMVFSLAPPAKNGDPWKETLLHNFTGADGTEPMAGLTFDATGSLYGTTCCGGKPGGGTIFRLTPSTPRGWALVVLHFFTGTTDGSYPAARVTLDKSGSIYGTTQYSGYTGGDCANEGCGTVFVVTP